MKKYRLWIIGSVCVVLSLVSAYLLVLTPKYIGDAVDVMVGENNVDIVHVRNILIVAVVMYAVYFILSWMTSLIANQVSVLAVQSIRNKLEYRLNRVPLSFLDTTSHGNLQSLFTMDGEMLIDGLYQLLSQLLVGVFTVIIAFVFMIQINVFMTAVVVVLVPVMYYTSKTIAKRSLVLYRKQQSLGGALSGTIQESMSNHQLIMSSNYQSSSYSKFSEIHEEYNIVGEKAQFLGALVNPTVRVINNLSYLLVGLVGALVAHTSGLTIGVLTSFISYSIVFSKPFNEFSAIVSQIMAAKASYDRIMGVMNVPLEQSSGEEVVLSGNEVTFEHVGFSYVANKPIIHDFSLSIPPLSKVAIVGPTGAGKSTLINVLMRFYDIDSGSIKIDGVDTKTLSHHTVRSVMSIVLQDPWLFEGTISQNLKYGNPDATDDQMIEAARQAGCHDYIMSLDKQYDTKVELGSRNISLGQRQMLTIARALLVNAPIIILDEATSNVDVLTEYKIQEVFRKIMSHRTSFFVAHRLATVVDSDVILVMKDGRLVEYGKHDELMAKHGFYHELFMSQFES